MRPRTPRAIWLLPLVISLALVAGTAPARADSGSAPSGGPVRIMLVGDSVTQGSAGDWTWRYRLWKSLMAQGVAFDFVGPRTDLWDRNREVPGNSDYADPNFDQDHAATWGMSFQTEEPPIAELVGDYHPDVIVELLGFNDLAYGASPVQTEDLLRAFIADARAGDPNVAVVVGGLPQTWIAGISRYDADLRTLASALSTQSSRVVPTTAPGFTEFTDTYDPAHPTARGEVKLAASIADALALVGVGNGYPRPLVLPPNGPGIAARLQVRVGDGKADLSWVSPPGADGVYVETRDVTAGQAWHRLPYPIAWPATRWTAGGLANGHLNQFRLRAVKGTAIAEDLASHVVGVRPGRPKAPVIKALTASRGGAATLTWASSRYANAYVVSYRDVSRGSGWVRAASPTPRARRLVVPGLRSQHRYAFSVRADNQSLLGGTSGQRSVLLPRVGPVRHVSASSPRRDVVLTSGHAVAYATSYQLLVARTARCGSVPGARSFHVLRTSGHLSKATVHTSARALWARWYAVRDGVTSVLAPTSTRCTRVR